MPWMTGAAIAGGSVISGALGSKGAGSSGHLGKTAKRKVQEGLDNQLSLYQPYADIGTNAMADGFGRAEKFDFNLEDDDIYKFSRDEALKATTRQMNAQGFGNSGNILTELNDRAVGVAGQYQNDAFNRQFGIHQDYQGQGNALLNMGYGATQNQAGAWQNNAGAYTGIGMQQMQNDMANDRFKYGSINNAVQGGISNYLTYDALKNGYLGGNTAYNTNPNVAGNNPYGY